MEKVIFIILILSSTLSSFGQYGKDRYDIDSLELFSMGELTYEFNLSGPSQGLYFDSTVYSNLPNITLKIVNNTKDTIVKRYKEQDDHLMWIRAGGSCGRCDTMLPGDYFILRSGWVWRNPIGPISTTIDIQYGNNLGWHNCIIKTWGELFPEGYSGNTNLVDNKIKYDQLPSTDLDSINTLYYYNWNGKQYVNPDPTGLYTYHVFKRDLDATGLDLDSIKSILRSKNINIKFSKPTAGILTSEETPDEAYYYTFKCTAKNVQEIKNVVKGINIHLMISVKCEPRYLDDSYRIFFAENLDWDERGIENFLKEKKITNYEYIPKTETSYPFLKEKGLSYYFEVKIILGNDQPSNLILIENLIDSPEVAWVISGWQGYSCED